MPAIYRFTEWNSDNLAVLNQCVEDIYGRFSALMTLNKRLNHRHPGLDIAGAVGHALQSEDSNKLGGNNPSHFATADDIIEIERKMIFLGQR